MFANDPDRFDKDVWLLGVQNGLLSFAPADWCGLIRNCQSTFMLVPHGVPASMSAR